MKRRAFRATLVVVIAGALLAGLALAGLSALGRFLVVADPLVPADAIFVLDGKTPARELEAAALYHRGFAPRVVVSLARDPIEVARRLAGEPPPQERSVRVLEHARVPAASIVRLDRVVENTGQELAADFEYARRHGFRRVILVTSPVHTRRVRIVWNRRYQAGVAALVHPAPLEPFDPDRWWRSRRWLEDGVHELVGIAHFLVGSPLPTFDRGG